MNINYYKPVKISYIVTGLSDVSLREGVSRDDTLRVMLGVVHPEYASRGGIQNYVRTQFFSELKSREMTIEDYVGRFRNPVNREKYRLMLEGESEIDKDLLEHLTGDFMVLDKSLSL
ncbi:hypothetical protein COV12_03770 [Candidatus Woesearchaeota archaeon CG10_big_fil_rev_8_21_14_0_10_32_24]|nr:MAG: hypothetical protein COV12_03770 [Candidatus Woesearchaeota archaeon CG10_big_fil_rev_8_21_14_0_10_32_24]